VDLAKSFFANAAWWRLNPPTYNVLSSLKEKPFLDCGCLSLMPGQPGCPPEADHLLHPIEGLAFGLKSEALGLDKHFVDPVPLLDKF